MLNDKKRWYLIALILPAASCVASEISSGVDEETKLPYWQVHDDKMSLRLVQRLPMQTRGYFLARGFNRQQVEQIAKSCVFQTVFKNISNTTSSPAALTYNLNDWQVVYHGERHSPKTREDWAKQWQQAGVAKPVQLAFEWSLYPTQQVYQPGDYNWGMTTFALPPGSVFDLRVSWDQSGKHHQATIQGIKCMEDLNLQPGDLPP
jgi:hypothetical protein